MVSQTKIEDIAKRVAICEEYAALWEEFFKTFGTVDFPERKILDQDEVRFAKLVTELAKQHFRFCYFMGDKFGDGDKIIDVLERAEGLRVVQELPEANFSKLEVDWHTVFISMHRAVGRLTHELPPEEPAEEEEGGKGKKKLKGKKRVVKPSVRAPSAPSATPKLGVSTAPKLGVPKPPAGGPPRPKGP